MRFREVPAAVKSVLTQPTWGQVFTSPVFTVVRDLGGKIRVVVEAPYDTEARRRAGCDRLKIALRSALGGWLGTEPAVWSPEEGPSVGALMGEIHRLRKHEPGWPPHVHLIERHAARKGWLQDIRWAPPWSLQDADNGTAPHLLTFFSHKGGVGRSTLLASAAITAARQGRRVLIVDLDLEAPGLGTLLGVSPQEGVVDLLFDDPPTETDVQNATLSINDPAIIGDSSSYPNHPLRVLAAGKVDSEYLDALARLDFQATEGPGNLLARIHSLFVAIRTAYPSLDYIFVDARAGFHDLGGMMLGGLTHGAILVATSSEQTWPGVEAVARVLAAPWRQQAGQSPVGLVAVHTLAPEETASSYDTEVKAFREKMYDTLSTHYYEQVPGPNDTTAAHYAEIISWSNSLRGQGGAIKGPMAALLSSGQFSKVYERICGLFKRPPLSSP